MMAKAPFSWRFLAAHPDRRVTTPLCAKCCPIDESRSDAIRFLAISSGCFLMALTWTKRFYLAICVKI
jgi:hypothetical protein